MTHDTVIQDEEAAVAATIEPDDTTTLWVRRPTRMRLAQT